MPQSGVPSASAQPFVADLHIHSKYSRACSRDLELPNLAWWARRKGVAVLGTGDITHPAWREHVREHLRPAEPGLYRLSGEIEADVDRRLPPRLAAGVPTRFLLSVEISTIYKRDGHTRKVHHLVYLPDLAAADRFSAALARIGNVASDGRPILGLDSRDLLEITLQASPDAYLVPAHIWTPWFSALGSKSGFDSIADCYADLAGHIFAVETGLSSDPAMNHRVSSLDAYRLVSSSDAHSPPALAREATTFTSAMDFFSMREAMRTGDGLHGTIEFFPEEGKYHADGHRACRINWSPTQTRAAGGVCPQCSKPVTVGVLSRVEQLADRAPETPAPHARQVTHLVPLAEVLSEIHRVGPKTKKVAGVLNDLLASVGSELDILTRTPADALQRAGGEVLAEAVSRLRRGQVRRTAGYDGEYGVIRLFAPGELDRPAATATGALFEVPQQRGAPTDPANGARGTKGPARTKGSAQGARGTGTRRSRRSVEADPPVPLPAAPSPHVPMEPVLSGMEEVGTGLLDRLDAMQRVAASAPGGPLLVVAGPGTGKTRTLTHRIAYLCAELGVSPDQCVAITFTRMAGAELRTRLYGLLGPAAEEITVATFHALGLMILRDHSAAAGLADGFQVASADQRDAAAQEAGADKQRYRKLLRADNLVDLDELVAAPLALLQGDDELVAHYRHRWPWIFVDEYQDVDADQYGLLRLLAGREGNLTAIGDPDQSIYSFRGADVGYFLRFAEDFTDTRTVRLTRNYRSAPPIIAAAVQAIAPATLVRQRRLDPARLDPTAPPLGRYSAASAREEAQFVARTIDALVGGVSHRSLDTGAGVDSRTPTGVMSFADISVLYRTDAQAAPVLEALDRAGIPAQKRTHNRLRDRPGVAEIARELPLLPTDGVTGGDLVEQVRQAGRRLAERHDQPTGADAAPKVTPGEIWTAVELLRPLAQRCGEDTSLLLAELAAGTEVDALDPRAQAVTLLTLHAAKGLESPVVFLIGVDDGLLPHRFPGTELSEEQHAEERRLFFVGITRAQDRLFISHSRRRPSPFLDVIDRGLFEILSDDGASRRRHLQPRLL